MLTFGWTKYAPLESVNGSVDPLRSLGIAMRLGELLFPGTSGRIWRIRYLSELCYTISLAETDPAKSYKENYKKVRRVENLFLVLHRLLANQEEDSGGHIIGTSKVGGLINNENRISLQNELMKNQGALGPMGIHLVSLIDMGLVNNENLTLRQRGEDLAESYRRNLGKMESVILSVRDSNFRSLNPVELEVTREISFAKFKNGSGKEERGRLIDLVRESSIRRDILSDIDSISPSLDKLTSDQDLIAALVDTNSPLKCKYLIAREFDYLMRCLYFCFNNLLTIPTGSVRYKIDNEFWSRFGFHHIKDKLPKLITSVREQSKEHIKAFEDPKDAITSIADYIDELESAAKSKEDFLDYMLDFHEKHQKSKGKAPWVFRVDKDTIEILPNQRTDPPLENFENHMDYSVHRYRIENAVNIVKDLDLDKAA